jgi:hypothetical protein
MTQSDPMLERIEAFNRGRGGVVVRRAANGYSLYSERSGGPVARLKPTGEDKVRVLAWHREKWGASGPFGVPTMTLDHALDYIASNPFFWIHA